MDIEFIKHALISMDKRGITEDTVVSIIKKGEKKEQGYRHIYQGKYFDEPLNCEMLLRVITETETSVATNKDVILVITAYKTSNFKKYIGD